MDKVELVSLDREELVEAEEEGVAEKELKLNERWYYCRGVKIVCTNVMRWQGLLHFICRQCCFAF